eukprot:TRINITY_DN13980_c0_g2_i1.p1 TRINITY_DN13980_c0_g2~~TRINITY_DN13980_c0_g2_i1.p1  ORF type:complete len:137 (-),score=11.99 TRINITY_DN13980_c0_g2_i1:79-489(-)
MADFPSQRRGSQSRLSGPSNVIPVVGASSSRASRPSRQSLTPPQTPSRSRAAQKASDESFLYTYLVATVVILFVVCILPLFLPPLPPPPAGLLAVPIILVIVLLVIAGLPESVVSWALGSNRASHLHASPVVRPRM